MKYLLDGNRDELDSYLQLEHFVRQLKIRARGVLSD
jgi:hypothetical protein